VKIEALFRELASWRYPLFATQPFFVAFQQNDFHSTANYQMQLPTADAVTRLRSLFPNNPRLQLYLGALGDLRGTGAPYKIDLGVDPQTGVDRGPVQFGTAEPEPQHLVASEVAPKARRID
jgi:hypothetical protein